MTSRSEFLGAAAAASAAPAIAANGPRPRSAVYDFAAIEAALARPARHRQVFASARIADGIVVALVNHGLDAYEIAMGEGPRSLHPAIVLYGGAAVLGLSDAVWTSFGLSLAARRRGEILSMTEGERANPFGTALRALTARGATLFVCDNALQDWSRFLPSMMGTSASPDRIAHEFRRNLLPSALLVPAGVATLNAAQEARFTYVQA